MNYLSKFGSAGRISLTLNGTGWLVSDCFSTCTSMGEPIWDSSKLENSLVSKGSILSGSGSSSELKRQVELVLVLCRRASTKRKAGAISKRLK